MLDRYKQFCRLRLTDGNVATSILVGLDEAGGPNQLDRTI